jgi:iron(III) transport system permease protein
MTTVPIASSRPERWRRSLAGQAPWIGLAALVTVLALIPIIPLQVRAFADGGAGIRQLLDMPGLGAVVRNTLLLGFGAMAVGMVIGTSLALSVYAMPNRLQSFLSFTPVLPMIIPSVAHVVGFVFLFSPENGYANILLRQLPFVGGGDNGPVNVYTPMWIIIYTGLHLSAFVYLFVFSGLKSLGADYNQAARVNGAGTLRVLFTVTLPMLRPVFVYAGMVSLLLSLGQFTGPLVLGRREGLDVLTTRMFVLTSDYPINYALVAALGTPLLVAALFLIFLQRRMVGDQKRFVGRGAMSMERTPASRAASFVATTYVVGFVFLSAILPLIALGYVSLSPFWSGRLSLDGLTFEHYSQAFAGAALRDAVLTSLVVTVVGVLVVMPLGLLVAIALTNKDRIWRPIAVVVDVFAALPLAVPGALVGFGFLFALSAPAVGLYGTRTALIIAYVTIMLPYAVRYQLATLISLGAQTTEASRVSGAGVLRTFGRIVLPLARGGMAASAAVMFVLLIHEFGVSLLLRSPDSTVMSVLLYDQFSTGSYPQVGVTAVVMTVITAAGVIAALVFGGTKAMERL